MVNANLNIQLVHILTKPCNTIQFNSHLIQEALAKCSSEQDEETCEQKFCEPSLQYTSACSTLFLAWALASQERHMHQVVPLTVRLKL